MHTRHLLAFLFAIAVSNVCHADDLGLHVAPGFRVTLYADHELANDIFAMTLDGRGRVVVTGPGYIKTLHDSKGVGRADKSTLFATPHSGGMGMCFDGDDLYFCGGGWFSRYRDSGGKGRADGPAEHILPMAHSEHGGHAIRKGPDGWWYLIGGNDSHFGKQHFTLPGSPIKSPEGGALLRLPPDCRQCEVIAQGFRNPYDFDFNPQGDLFTYDSDCEREFFLPWYTPTRMYHIGYGLHHGWRLPGYLRSWCRRDFYLDAVDMLWPVGRGSPTGVACYRHTQFPEHYRGGIFALDWTFGKVYFFALHPNGATYRTQPEVFLESTGTSGFDPTDAAVAPDGALLISMGGRGTRGAVYRIEYIGDEKLPRKAEPGAISEIESVLRAPQPLDAWSRAQWMPRARKLGPDAFAAIVTNEKLDAPARVRAIEILTELFGGLSEITANTAAQSTSPAVRARIAWAIGRMPFKHHGALVCKLARDTEAVVRRNALETLADKLVLMPAGCDCVDALLSGFAHPDKRVRQAAARAASALAEDSFRRLQRLVESENPQAQLTAALAGLWRSPEYSAFASVSALRVLGTARENDLLLQAIRLLMLALGDYRLDIPRPEIYTGYSLAGSSADDPRAAKPVLQVVRPLFPSPDERLNEEVARLLAMLEDDDPELPGKIAAMWSAKSSATEDVHYLICLSRLRGMRSPAVTTAAARALLGLHRKLEGREQRIKQVWADRLAELVQQLLVRDPRLADELLRRPEFVDAGHVIVAANLDAEHRRRAAHLFLKATQKDADFAWSGPLIELLGLLPSAEVRPLLRAQWTNFGLRDEILLRLAPGAEAIDRERFLFGLQSNQQQVVGAALAALQQLPRDDSPRNAVPILRLLRRLIQEPKERPLRKQALELFARQCGNNFSVKETADDSAALKRAYQLVFSWFEHEHPTLMRALNDASDEDPALWDKTLRSVEWKKGNAARGEVIFRARACQTCHSGSRALGPDLTGVTSRFSREDLFNAILYPSRDVAPAYRTSVIETRNGQLVTGIVAFESADGLIVQTGATTTVRLATADIVSRLSSDRSLMPNGLLKDLKPLDLADLYSYLQTLKPAK